MILANVCEGQIKQGSEIFELEMSENCKLALETIKNHPPPAPFSASYNTYEGMNRILVTAIWEDKLSHSETLMHCGAFTDWCIMIENKMKETQQANCFYNKML